MATETIRLIKDRRDNYVDVKQQSLSNYVHRNQQVYKGQGRQ